MGGHDVIQHHELQVVRGWTTGVDCVNKTIRLPLMSGGGGLLWGWGGERGTPVPGLRGRFSSTEF